MNIFFSAGLWRWGALRRTAYFTVFDPSHCFPGEPDGILGSSFIGVDRLFNQGRAFVMWQAELPIERVLE